MIRRRTDDERNNYVTIQYPGTENTGGIDRKFHVNLDDICSMEYTVTYPDDDIDSPFCSLTINVKGVEKKFQH